MKFILIALFVFVGVNVCLADEDDLPIVLREFNTQLENLKENNQETMNNYAHTKLKIIYIFTAKLVVFNKSITEESMKFAEVTRSPAQEFIEIVMNSMKPFLQNFYSSFDPKVQSPKIANEMFESYFERLVQLFQNEIINIILALEKSPDLIHCWEMNKKNIFNVIDSNFGKFLEQITHEIQKLAEEIKTIEDDFEVISKEVVETFNTCSEITEPENCLHNFVTDRKDQILEQINASFVQLTNAFKNAIVKNNARVQSFIKKTETEYNDIKTEMIACFIVPTTVEIDSSPHQLKKEL
ncbi:unnamed protein product [Diamesa serratosioi]